MKKKLFICTILIFSMGFFASSEKCSQRLLTLPKAPVACNMVKPETKIAENPGADMASLLPRFIIIE